VLGGPVGAAVVGGATYLFNKSQSSTEPEQPQPSVSYSEQVSDAYTNAAQDYLTHFSAQAFSTLRQYEEIAEKTINSQITQEPVQVTAQHHQLKFLQTLLATLNHELELISTLNN
jgi:hypothetical protein